MSDHLGKTIDIACISVAGDQPKGLALTATADEDTRPWQAERWRRAQRLGQLVVLASIRSVVGAPHLHADLQRLLEPFEAFGQWGEGDPQSEVLTLVPGGPKAELSSTA